MWARTVVLVAAMGVGLAGCGGSDDPSSAAEPTTMSTSTTTTTVTTTTVTTTTVTTTTTPAKPRALGISVAPKDPAPPATDQSVPPNGERPLTEVEVGECIDVPGLHDPEATELVTAITVGCDEPHDAEIYARVSLNDDPDADHPGDEHVVAAADQVCFERFEPYVGVRYVDARLEIVHLRPTVASWQRGDRSVVCMLINSNREPLAGSMAGGQ